MPTLEGRLWTSAGWLSGRLHFGAVIEALEPCPGLDGPDIVPGFVDVHVHGGGGYDAADGEPGVRGLARFHARRGTTTLLPTTLTRPWAEVLGVLAAIRAVRDAPGPQEADVIGAHLEGPFLHPGKLGAQPPFALEPEPQRIEAVLASGVLRVVTLAPELPGAAAAAFRLAQSGVRVSLGHTLGRAEDAQAVMRAVRAAGGVVGGTHLFNAMSGLSGREPGVAGALLADAHAYAEVIVDGHHVHPASVLAAWRALGPRLLLVTDAMRAAGLGDGVYDLGGQAVQVSGGQARLSGGSLAGSLLSMDLAVRGAVEAGIGLHPAIGMASAQPARYLGLSDRGELRRGLRADVLVLDRAQGVQRVFLAGQELPTIQAVNQKRS
jgi:N-acetylglucosamine-6-phosphate deacetylase